MEKLTTSQMEGVVASEKAPKGQFVGGDDWREKTRCGLGKSERFKTKSKS